MSKKPFLVTLLPAIEVDLGRWLLHLWQIDYDEHPHAPIFHVLALFWYGVGPKGYPLFIRDGQKYSTVKVMVEKFDPLTAPEHRLVPDATSEKALHDEVMKLRQEFHAEIGSGSRTWAYFNLLPHKKLTWPSFTAGVPWWETFFLSFGYGVIKLLMSMAIGLGAKAAEQGLDKVRADFDRCEEMLSDGRQYLVGDRLTLADLTFATAGAPMVLANGYGGHLPTIEQVPPEMRSIIAELRARPAGAYIQRIYDEHRLKAPAREQK
jgi:glutathione S-transferase